MLVSEQDAVALEELVTQSLMLRSVDKIQTHEWKEKLNEFQREVGYRLARLENVVYGTKQEPVREEEGNDPVLPGAADLPKHQKNTVPEDIVTV